MKFEKKEAIIFCLLVVMFLMFNLPLFFSRYHSDMLELEGWGNTALEKGLAELYKQRLPTYPPLYMYVLRFNAWLHLKLFGNLIANSHSYIYISKIVPTLCNLLIGIGLFWHFKKASFYKAIIAMSLYFFNLGVIYNTAIWGQIDSVYACFIFFSLLMLMHRHYVLSTVFFTLGILTKVQAIVIFPILAIVIFKELVIKKFDFKKLFSIIFSTALIVFIVFIPFLYGGVYSNVIATIEGSVGKFAHVTMNAYNPWYLLSPGVPARSDFDSIWGMSFLYIGSRLFILYCILVMYQLIKSKHESDASLAAAGVAFAFFMLPTEIHERYLFPFFALLSFAIFDKRKYLFCYVAITFTFLLNLMMIMSFGDLKSSSVFYAVQLFISFMVKNSSFIQVAKWIAILNTILFLYFNATGIFRNFLSNVREDFLRVRKYLVSFIWP